jgi:hypothetical protein|tara:strand:- start:97 stop:270 length:174 start_codon:yes stop_codon:yes gene_type:complete
VNWSRDFPEPDYEQDPPDKCEVCGLKEYDADDGVEFYPYDHDDYGNPMMKCTRCYEC